MERDKQREEKKIEDAKARRAALVEKITKQVGIVGVKPCPPRFRTNEPCVLFL